MELMLLYPIMIATQVHVKILASILPESPGIMSATCPENLSKSAHEPLNWLDTISLQLGLAGGLMKMKANAS